ncbi:hypothetical protein [Streptomyces sp. NPDC060002]|uniref:hypothetical protein n=1 Tax=Streptomyces sp. NPDC060002 TaxID=3347033 RepID=UPI0036A4C2EF
MTWHLPQPIPTAPTADPALPPGWAAEPKWDGYRAQIARYADGRVLLRSRHGTAAGGGQELGAEDDTQAGHAFEQMRALGAEVVEIGTGGDQFHAPARALYEALGCTAPPLPVYFRQL